MNWVGGARSRVKYFNNNKVQRDYFECKRLAAKVQRLEPSRKKTGSQDLYFFSNTLTGELKPGSSSTQNAKPTKPTKPAKLTKLEARRDLPCMKDLELSMSPIGQPSMLDIMDVTDMSADDQELSLYGPEPVKEQPRMSTQKLPHLIKRESCGDHPKSDIRDDDESLLSLGLDFSTTSESIFPPPTKKLKPEISAPSNPYSKYKQTTTILKNYCIDEALNAPCFNKSLVPAGVFNLPTIATESHKSSKDTSRRSDYGELDLVKRKKSDSKAAVFRKPERRLSRKHQVPYHQHNTTSHGGERRRKSVVAYDQDAMLEFHYEEQGHSSRDERKHKNKYQRVPETAKEHFKIDFGGIESAAVPSHNEQASLPAVSVSNATQSAWSSDTITKHPSSVSSIGLSENPFPKTSIAEPSTIKEMASHTNLDESVLHPIVDRAKQKEIVSYTNLSESILNPIRGPKIRQQDVESPQEQYDTTLFDESIFGPIQKKAGLETGAGSLLKAYQHTTSKKSSKTSTFELMMKSFERERRRRRDVVDSDKEKEHHREKQPAAWGEGTRSKPRMKNLEWKNFIDGVQDTKPLHVDQSHCDEKALVSQSNESYCQQEVPDSERTQSTYGSCGTNSKMAFGNISVLEELICLEEENAADLISQDFPISPADWTEDPIFIQAHEGQRRVHRPACGFDSSQESMEMAKGSSWNDSNDNSMPGCNPSLNSEPTMCTNHPPSPCVDDHHQQQQEELQQYSPIEVVTAGEKVHHASSDKEEVKGNCEHIASSQTMADVCTQGSKAVKNIHAQNANNSQVQSNSQTRFNANDGTLQTVENIKVDKSTQSSLGVMKATARSDTINNSPHTETQSASQCECNMEVLTKATGIQTEIVASDSHITLPKDEFHLTGTLTKRTALTDKSGQYTRDIDKLKKELARLERELGMAQSTLVWQSLMMRLQQIDN